MSRERVNKAQDYIIKHFVTETPLHLEITEALKADGKFGVNVSPYEGYLLQFLMQMIGAKAVIEIGALYGYSALWMSLVLPKDGRLVALEKNPENYEKAKGFLKKSPNADQIQIQLGDAIENLKQIDFEPDFIFIDADKPNYFNYLEWAMAKIKPGGLIVGDNTFLWGHMIGEDRGERTSASAIASMSKFNETLAKAPGFRSIMIPTFEGLTVAQKVPADHWPV